MKLEEKALIIPIKQESLVTTPGNDLKLFVWLLICVFFIKKFKGKNKYVYLFFFTLQCIITE